MLQARSDCLPNETVAGDRGGTFAGGLDDRHCDADLGPQAGDDQLLAAGRFDDFHHILVLPGVHPGAIDDFLVWKYVGDLFKEKSTARRDHAGENGRNIEGFC